MRATALALVLVAAGCSLASSTPEPSASIDPTDQPSVLASSDPTAGPTEAIEPTDLLTPEPTVAATPEISTPSAPPTPSPSIVSSPVWDAVGGLPGGLTITGLGGFDVTVTGYLPAGSSACPDATEPVVSTYQGDDEWFDTIGRNQWYGAVDVLVMPYGFNAIGRAIPRGQGCGPMSVTSWAPTDKSDWYEAGLSGIGLESTIEFATITKSWVTVIAGDYGNGSDKIGVWVSEESFELTADRAAEPPSRPSNKTFSAIGRLGETVVGFDGSQQPAWYSLDSGNTWSASEYRPSFWFLTSGIAASGDKLYASGLVCCTDVGKRVGAVIRSDDGEITWSPDPALLPTVPEAIVADDDLLIALGKRTYVSRDGMEWHEGPRLPGYEGGEVQVFGVDLYADIIDEQVYVATPNARLWQASLTSFNVDGWPRAPIVNVPGVGYSEQSAVSTHCGVNGGSVLLGLKTWAPELPNGEYPASFGPDQERGVFTIVGPTRLEFAGQHGDTILYQPDRRSATVVPVRVR